MAKKRLSDTEVMALKAAQRESLKDVQWFYDSVVKVRSNYTDEKAIKKAFTKINKKVEAVGLCSPKIVLEEILGWEKGKDTESRNRYLKLTNSIAVSNGYGHSDVHQMFLDATKRYLLDDFDHPTDAFLSKKEARQVRKDRRLRKKHGAEEKTIKVTKTDDEKKEARKLRAAIRKKADELGIDREEFKKGLETGKYKL